VTAALDALIEELQGCDRQERIELLIDLARSLPPLPEHLAEHKDEAHRVPECMSPVFLFADLHDGRVVLHAEVPVEAPTVRGFVAMLVEGLNGATAQDVLEVPSDLVERSGVAEILGMQRVGGLSGVVRRLKAMVSRALAAAEPPPRTDAR
jgi:cysteine desulfuration protein SufE